VHLRLTISLSAAALILAVGCSPEASSPPAEEAPPEVTVEGTPVDAAMLERGAEVYTESCADCHGTGGRGDGPMAPDLDPVPRDQTDASHMDTITDREIAETIVFGGAVRGLPSMPASPQVFGDDLVALVAFTRSLSRPDLDLIELGADSF
jgi:mono/diheme cytochrome c family protein